MTDTEKKLAEAKVSRTIENAFELYDKAMEANPMSMIDLLPGPKGSGLVTVKINGVDVTSQVESKLDPTKMHPCRHCGEFACHADDIKGLLKDREEDFKDCGWSNHQIRHSLYRESSFFINGILGKDNRKELPKCVVDLIRDTYPNPETEDYVGFKIVQVKQEKKEAK